MSVEERKGVERKEKTATTLAKEERGRFDAESHDEASGGKGVLQVHTPCPSEKTPYLIFSSTAFCLSASGAAACARLSTRSVGSLPS